MLFSRGVGGTHFPKKIVCKSDVESVRIIGDINSTRCALLGSKINLSFD